MINIINKELCSGCGACQQKCPKQSISLVEDFEGFLYPIVDSTTCINCGICDNVCHETHPYKEHLPLKVIAATNNDEYIRINSSSGGIFSMLAEEIISNGGVVFGARFDDDWQVIIDYTETKEGLSAFRGSKYVQARIENAFKKAEGFIKENRQVLFSGTPCQIAGLHHYLNRTYDNLYTIDFVCHGVPSPKVWERYLDELTRQKKSLINDIQFRNKTDGWKKFRLSISFLGNAALQPVSCCFTNNTYMQAFLSNLILRPSCYNCKAKKGASKSDITIADFWGINHLHPEMDDDKGTSLVMINSQKGLHILENQNMNYIESDYGKAVQDNPGIKSLTKPHPNRDEFFNKMGQVNSIANLITIENPILKGFHPKTIIKRIIKKYKLYNENRHSNTSV